MVLVLRVFKAVIVRLVLLTHSLLVIGMAAGMMQDKRYWLLAIAVLGMLAEGLITVVKNKGQEWKWFCPCFLFYLFSTIPGIWVLELNRMTTHQDKSNITADLQKEVFGKVGFEVKMEQDKLVMIVEQLFLYLMILSRWFLPRGDITRDELSQLLFLFIGIASDITELFALFEESKVREKTWLTYVILAIWTLSLFQFTFVLTSTHNPKKSAVAVPKDINPVPGEIEDEQPDCLKHMFQTEIWSIFINFMLQDGPFLAVRLYTMIALKVLTYSIIFFTAKNGLLVMLLIYRLIVVCCSHKAKIEAENEEESFGSQNSKKVAIETTKNAFIAEKTTKSEAEAGKDGQTQGSAIDVVAIDDVEKGIAVEEM